MTEKRFSHKDESLYIDNDYFCELEDGNEITELLNRQQYTVETVWKENEQLKKALKELLEEYGNSYYIDLFDKLFNLEYREWHNPTAPNNEPYVDWEKIAKEKELEK